MNLGRNGVVSCPYIYIYIYKSRTKWTWHHSKFAIHEVSFYHRLKVVLLQLLSIHDGAVGMMDLDIMLLWSRPDNFGLPDGHYFLWQELKTRFHSSAYVHEGITLTRTMNTTKYVYVVVFCCVSVEFILMHHDNSLETGWLHTTVTVTLFWHENDYYYVMCQKAKCNRDITAHLLTG